MKYYYYSIKNNKNGKQYIGITTNIKKRWEEHKRNLNQNCHVNNHLQNAWNLDKQYFSFQILEEKDFINEKEAYDYEWELIQKYGDYNILQGSMVNPMYTPEIREKMTKTKQSQVENIYQIQQVDENTYQIIKEWNSMKEPCRLKNFDFRNICNSVKNWVKGDGFYWVKKSEIEFWKPKEIYNNYVAEINEDGDILSVSKSPRLYEKENNWATSSIVNAIKRNGKTHNRKFKFISYEEYLKYKPLIINPVSTRAEA